MQSVIRFPETTHRIAVLSAAASSVTRGLEQVQQLTGAVPPSFLVLLSCFAVQTGSAMTKSLFASLGSMGAALVCKGFAAVLLLVLVRPQWRHHRVFDYLLIGGMGLAIASMSLAFYGAIDRIPLGIASTIEFIGPLGVAVIGSRRLLDLLWVGLAASGVLLLAPFSGASLDPMGILLALLSAVCWAAYILLSVPLGRCFPGKAGLAMAMAGATVFLAIPGVNQAGAAILHPHLLAIGLVVAILGTVVPYSLEFTALKRMPARIFGVLLSIEPAIAALVGLVFLGEMLEFRTLIAIGLVTSAAIGVTLSGRRAL